MLPLIFNPAPLIFTLATTFGVLVHDTQVDRAASFAVAVPVAFASFAAIDSAIKSTDHVQVERAMLPHVNVSVPRIQPRDDERRYVQSRKLFFGTEGSGYFWPSI
jgi:hypothetical protein